MTRSGLRLEGKDWGTEGGDPRFDQRHQIHRLVFIDKAIAITLIEGFLTNLLSFYHQLNQTLSICTVHLCREVAFLAVDVTVSTLVDLGLHHVATAGTPIVLVEITCTSHQSEKHCSIFFLE